MPIERTIYDLGRYSGTRPRMIAGWNPPTEVDTWTNEPAATLIIPRPALNADHFLVMRMLIRPDMPEQRVRVMVRDAEVARFTVLDRVVRAARVPASLLAADPELPITFHVEPEGVALGSIALQPDLDPAPPPPADLDPSDAAMMLRFESLGENCEFGLLQRAAGAEPLGLLRFASTNLQRLIAALDNGFAGLGEPSKLSIETENGQDYMVHDHVFGLHYHAWVKVGEMPPEAVHQREVRRVPFLIRRLTEDLESGHKIFVRHELGRGSDSGTYALLPALRRWGPNTLLYVKVSDAAHPPGTVERREPGLLVGYIERFAPGENAHDFLTPQWLAICRIAQGLVWPALAPDPPSANAAASNTRAEAVPARAHPGGVSLSSRLALRPQNGEFESAGSAARSVCQLAQLETAPFWVRLLLPNDQQDSYELSGAAVAATCEAGDGISPSGEPPVAWRNVTFASHGEDSEPGTAPQDGPRSLVVSAGHASTPTRVWSDWVMLPGVGRGQGDGAFLLLRSFSTGQLRFSSFAGRFHAALGRAHAGHWMHGDGTQPPFGTEWHRYDRLSACWGLQYVAAAPGASVVGIGDGVVQGYGSDGAVSGFGLRACLALTRPDRPISWWNEGHLRHGSAEYFVAGLWAIENLRPQVTLIQTWSANDPPAEEAAGAALSRAMALADATRRIGGRPILLTAAPACRDSAEQEAVRQHSLKRVRALRDTVPVLDLDELWCGKEQPAGYQPQFGSADQLHPSNAGCAAAADALVPLLRAVLGEG